eukprot:gb/GECH01011301.1/.p1 GENE.gb/GECH01011301.1/~~gb/GECH01011301.1/.p1  ORF type:complete len:240 (+),score=46.28 gb/GECH01011301.1/:1-720(+)
MSSRTSISSRVSPFSDDENTPRIGKRGSKNNPLLVRKKLGRGKDPTTPLPGPEFSYGKPSPADPEPLKSLISSWKKPKAKTKSKKPIDFVKLNKMSVKNKATTSSDVSSFRNRTPSPPSRQRQRVYHDIAPQYQERPYGSPTRYGIGVKDLIENKYEREWVYNKSHEEDMKWRKEMEDKMRRMGRSQSALASYKSRSSSRTRSRSPSPSRVSEFKLKQFEDVSPKVQVPKGRSCTTPLN